MNDGISRLLGSHEIILGLLEYIVASSGSCLFRFEGFFFNHFDLTQVLTNILRNIHPYICLKWMSPATRVILLSPGTGRGGYQLATIACRWCLIIEYLHILMASASDSRLTSWMSRSCSNVYVCQRGSHSKVCGQTGVYGTEWFKLLDIIHEYYQSTITYNLKTSEQEIM